MYVYNEVEFKKFGIGVLKIFFELFFFVKKVVVKGKYIFGFEFDEV